MKSCFEGFVLDAGKGYPGNLRVNELSFVGGGFRFNFIKNKKENRKWQK